MMLYKPGGYSLLKRKWQVLRVSAVRRRCLVMPRYMLVIHKVKKNSLEFVHCPPSVVESLWAHNSTWVNVNVHFFD